MKSDKKPLEHISFIMDGNGRWAQKRFLPRSAGHSEGVKKAKEVILLLKNRGIKTVSLYTFSKENWKRSVSEVSFLMDLILKHLRDEFEFYLKNEIRIKHIGDREGVPQSVLEAIDKVEKETQHFNTMTVMLAFNYSGKYDIVQAVNRLLSEGDHSITENDFEDKLLTTGFSDPDLIVRTSGEFRLSNYFLWQAAYSEFLLIDKLWPDINEKDIDFAINYYYERDRRFGGVNND